MPTRSSPGTASCPVCDGDGDDGGGVGRDEYDGLPGVERPEHLLHLVDVLLLRFAHLGRGVWGVRVGAGGWGVGCGGLVLG